MPTTPNPISDCEVRDPRIRRTRQLLQGALGSLMQTKSFEEISVQDIAEVSTINRATFYDHYTDKYALLEATVAGGFHQLLHQRNIQYDGTCASAASAIILAVCDFLEQAHQRGNCTKQNPFEPLIDAAITVAIRRVLVRGIKSNAAQSQNAVTLSPEIVATAASWAIYGAVKEWFNTPERSQSSEIVPRILQLVVPILLNVGASGLELAHTESLAVPRS